MKHDAEFAFFAMLNMWVVHLRSSEICTLICMHYFECEVVQSCPAFRRIVHLDAHIFRLLDAIHSKTLKKNVCLQ